jgi:TRAP-type transport system periplasmic protein
MIHRLSRRSFVAVSGVALSAPFVSRAWAQEFTLKLHSFSSPTALDQTLHLGPWAEKIAKESGGRLKIQIFPAMQLGGRPADLPQQLEDGIVDMIWMVAGFAPGRFPGTEGVELPFMATGKSETQSPAAMEFALKYLLAKEYKNIKICSIHTTDGAVLHTVSKPVRTLEDMKGMRIRVAGKFIGEAVKAFGGTPVGIPLPGIYEALSRGQVDGMYINWAITLPYKFYEVTKHHTDTTLFQGNLLTLMRQESFDKLPDDLKKVIDANSGIERSRELGRIWDSQTQPARDATIKNGNNVFSLTPEERARWVTAAKPAYDAWIDDMNKRGNDGKAMFDDLQAIVAKYARA